MNTRVDLYFDVNLGNVFIKKETENSVAINEVKTGVGVKKSIICFVVIQNLDLILADIDLLDQDILQLLEYWNKIDYLKHNGTSN